MAFFRGVDLFLYGVALFQLLSKGHAFAPLHVQHHPFTRPGLSMSKADSMTEEERAIALEKATKAMTAFTNKYLENTSTYLCSDTSVPAVVIKGLAEHKVTLGAPLCPCRFYDDKEKEAKDGFWNCPCVPMRERHECHCMLFLTEDNDFVGPSQVWRMLCCCVCSLESLAFSLFFVSYQHITVEEVLEKTDGFEG
jgi:ferredoxin-thioredoxin reductase catalytic subunit